MIHSLFMMFNSSDNIQEVSSSGNKGKRLIFILAISFLSIIILMMIGLLFYLKSQSASKINEKNQKAASSSSKIIPSGRLPDDSQKKSNSKIATSSSPELAIEKILFGDFYHQEKFNVPTPVNDYDLPLNVKADASNYYDLSRKIEIKDDEVKKLNQNGFVIIDDQFNASNLNDLYRVLLDKNIPIVVSRDYLLFYYQAILKQSFKEIEKNIFYEKLWNISRQMFSVSYKRYEERRLRNGLVNDPVLEGERMEVAYLAVILKLLEPNEKQVNTNMKFVDENKFTPQESEKFFFDVPRPLKDDVNKELKLIRDANSQDKSPILFYQIDYSQFKPPQQYKTNAKLNNFYLATHWLNSVFPLYYKGDACPDCLLDKEDWRISMVAASFLAKDMASSDEFKKEWASIYKIIAFFRGLRQDLTYLHYNDVLKEVFGPNYNIEELFTRNNLASEDNFNKLQMRLSQFNFTPLEGGIERNNSKTQPMIGLKILQDSYWPDNYILKHLTYPYVDVFLGTAKSRKELPITACKISKEDNYYRCCAIGLDVVNLIHPIQDNNYFFYNTNYENYNSQVNNFRNILTDKFNLYSWHSNNFWTTIYTLKNFLSNNAGFAYEQSQDWEKQKINSSLGAWLDLQLPGDKFVFADMGSSHNSFYMNEDGYDYIEADLVLIKNLEANVKMFLGMFSALKLNDVDNTASLYLQDLLSRLNKIETIINKELNGEKLEKIDIKFIHDFIRQFIIKKSPSKSMTISFYGKQEIKEELNGVKILLLATKQAEKIIINVGAMFNYYEGK